MLAQGWPKAIWALPARPGVMMLWEKRSRVGAGGGNRGLQGLTLWCPVLVQCSDPRTPCPQWGDVRT